MLAFTVNNPELILGGLVLASQWGYTMHRLKSLETSIDEIRLELREKKKNESASA